MKKEWVIGIIVLSIIGISFGWKQLSTKPTNQPLKKVVFADASQMIGTLVYIATTKEFFKNEGLDIIFKPYTSGKSSLQAVLDGKADLATTAETPIVHAIMKGKSISIVASIGTSDKENSSKTMESATSSN
ncbi:MAG: hypothetical protein ACI86H_001552 [bacterium]|jgi:hypothetical protein